jgi:hypothetical protein
MSDQDQIVKAIDPEVIPKTELRGIETALYDLHIEKAKLPAIKVKLEAKEITDLASYTEVGTLVQQARAIAKQGETKMAPFKAIVNAAWDIINGWQKTHQVEADDIAKIGADKQAAWNKKERERTEAENQRKQRELRDEQNRKAEAQRIEDEKLAGERRKARVLEIRGMLKRKEITLRQSEKLLREAGATEEADKAQAKVNADQVAAAVPQVKVEPLKATVGGQRARAPWVFKITDITKIPREMLLPYPDDDGTYDVSKFPRIREMVKETKDKVKAEAQAGGGIEVWQDDRV